MEESILRVAIRIDCVGKDVGLGDIGYEYGSFLVSSFRVRMTDHSFPSSVPVGRASTLLSGARLFSHAVEGARPRSPSPVICPHL